MSRNKLVTVILGTRPEAIKLAPVILKFKELESIETRVILTGQHSEMVEHIMNLFNIIADNDLKIMKEKQTLVDITCKVLKGVERDFSNYKPDLVIVQGDTTSAFAGALAAFYNKIPIAHVEAGLRTNNLLEPYPEEANRRLISEITNLHFAPTSVSEKNLLSSNTLGKIIITGNTVIDSLLLLVDKIDKFNIPNFNDINQRMILVTVHRRENWEEGIINICNAIKKILHKHNDIIFLIPLHPNKIVRKPFQEILGNYPQVIFSEPLPYDKLISVIKQCYFLMTDSGGLQEEAPALSKPVLVLRDTTERPEAIEAGTAKLIGTNSSNIFEESDLLLSNKKAYEKMAKVANPFGDGNASKKIRECCISFLNQ